MYSSKALIAPEEGGLGAGGAFGIFFVIIVIFVGLAVVLRMKNPEVCSCVNIVCLEFSFILVLYTFFLALGQGYLLPKAQNSICTVNESTIVMLIHLVQPVWQCRSDFMKGFDQGGRRPI